MTAFIHDDAHIDVCVAAITNCPELDYEGRNVTAWNRTALGKRLLRANLEAWLWTHAGHVDDCERDLYEQVLTDYRFRTPTVIAAMPVAERVATYAAALLSLGWQCSAIDNWPDSELASLLHETEHHLVHELIRTHAIDRAHMITAATLHALTTPASR